MQISMWCSHRSRHNTTQFNWRRRFFHKPARVGRPQTMRRLARWALNYFVCLACRIVITASDTTARREDSVYETTRITTVAGCSQVQLSLDVVTKNWRQLVALVCRWSPSPGDCVKHDRHSSLPARLEFIDESKLMMICIDAKTRSRPCDSVERA